MNMGVYKFYDELCGFCGSDQVVILTDPKLVDDVYIGYYHCGSCNHDGIIEIDAYDVITCCCGLKIHRYDLYQLNHVCPNCNSEVGNEDKK